jgi:hypothetical protein
MGMTYNLKENLPKEAMDLFDEMQNYIQIDINNNATTAAIKYLLIKVVDLYKEIEEIKCRLPK